MKAYFITMIVFSAITAIARIWKMMDGSYPEEKTTNLGTASAGTILDFALIFWSALLLARLGDIQ